VFFRGQFFKVNVISLAATLLLVSANALIGLLVRTRGYGYPKTFMYQKLFSRFAIRRLESDALKVHGAVNHK
jgi:hypothetical protein